MRFQFRKTIPLSIVFLCISGICAGQDEFDLERAGCPHLIAPYARPSYGSHYIAYYVGGGAAPFRRGSMRTCDEGTFGVDYNPGFSRFRSGVVLNWWHGRHRQGGTGQFEPNSLVNPIPNLGRR